MATSANDQLVKLWNPTTNWNLVQTYNYLGSVYAFEYINATTMASGGQDKKVQLWSIKTAKLIKTISPGGPVNCLQLLTKSSVSYLIIGAGPFVLIYNINSGNRISVLNGHKDTVTDLVLTGNTLISSSRDKTIRIWDITTITSTMTSTRTLNGHANQVYGLKLVSRDKIASASIDQTVRLWSISSGSLINTLTGNTNYMQYSVDFLDCGSFVSGDFSNNDGIKVWDTFTGGLLDAINSDNMQINTVAVINQNTGNYYLETTLFTHYFILFIT